MRRIIAVGLLAIIGTGCASQDFQTAQVQEIEPPAYDGMVLSAPGWKLSVIKNKYCVVRVWGDARDEKIFRSMQRAVAVYEEDQTALSLSTICDRDIIAVYSDTSDEVGAHRASRQAAIQALLD